MLFGPGVRVIAHGKDGIELFVGAGTQRGPCARRFSLDSRGGVFLSLLVFSPRTALIALLAAAVSLGFLLLISRYSAQNAPVEAQANRDMTGAILEYARGLAVVKSFGRDIPLEHFDIAFDRVSFGYDDRQLHHSGKDLHGHRRPVQLRQDHPLLCCPAC